MKRISNQKPILNLIRERGPISRTEVIRILQMRPGTALESIEELRQKGLIEEAGKAKSTGGRRPVLLKLIPEARFAIGLHLRKRDTVLVVVDLQAGIVYEDKVKNRFKDKKTLLGYISKNLDKIFRATKISTNRILGVGLAIPGLVDREKGICLFSTYYSWWKDIALRKPLEKKFHLPISLENDTKSLTLAERWFGRGKERDNFLYLDLGEGIGLGIFLNGEIHEGKGAAGEFGHTTIDLNGPLCRCGKRGCLETFVSTTVLKRKAERAFNRNISLPEMLRLAEKRERKTLQILERAGKYLAIGIGNLINLFNPGLIIIGGPLSQFGNFLLEPMRQNLSSQVLKRPLEDVTIVSTQLGEDAGVRGAASLILKKFFQ